MKTLNIKKILSVLLATLALAALVAVPAFAEEPAASAPAGEAPASAPATAAPAASAARPATAAAPTGEVELSGVSEREAAMIMAIVANAIGKPPAQLRFHSLKEAKRP